MKWEELSHRSKRAVHSYLYCTFGDTSMDEAPLTAEQEKVLRADATCGWLKKLDGFGRVTENELHRYVTTLITGVDPGGQLPIPPAEVERLNKACSHLSTREIAILALYNSMQHTRS